MLIMLLIILSILSSSLYSMKNNHKDWLLYKQFITTPHHSLTFFSHHPNIVNTFGTIIDMAENINNGYLMAKLIYACLPLDIVKTYINPHLAQAIEKKYRQKLISYKYSNNLFKEKPIFCNENNLLITITNHDGAYKTAPHIGCNYTLWQTHGISAQHMHPNKKTYSHLLLSNNSKKSMIYSLAEHNTKKLHYLFSINYNKTQIKFDLIHPLSHYLFSADCTLLALCFVSPRTHINIEIYNTKKLSTSLTKGYLITLDGTIKTLCAAHHSPIFVAGSNSFGAKKDQYNLVHITKKRQTFLKGHTSPVICTEFSPDDKRLLTCSYNPITQTSQLKLWDTSNNNNILCLYNAQYNEHILKAFFIHNGQRIITINNKGSSHLLDGITGYDIKKYKFNWNSCCAINKNNTPLCIWSTINQLYMSIFKNNICIRKSTTGALLAPMITLTKTPTQAGLTDDENIIVFVDNNQKAYQLELYNQKDYNEINFIENHANIIQLYTLFNICKNNKGTAKTTSCVKIIKSYIQKQETTKK